MPRKNSHPHVAWRDGRPRFSPARQLRALGYAGTDLRWPESPPAGWKVEHLKPGDRHAGRWFSKGEAVDWSAAFLRSLRKPAAAPIAPAPARPKIYTVGNMLADWFARSPKFIDGGQRAYAANTMRFYRLKVATLQQDHPLVFNGPAQLVSRPMLRSAYERTWRERGLSAARAMIATLSAAYSWAILNGRVKRQDNPAQKLEMEVPDPRIRFATRREFHALVAAADALGRPEIGDMAYLAVWTGQRQDDRLNLVAASKLNGRRIFRQAKTGAVVAIREAPELEARLASAKERRAGARATALLAARSPEERRDIELRFAHVILDEVTWQPFKRFWYAREFARIRDHAAIELSSVGDFHDADWRDTAVTWQGLAGATIPEIIAVTGHTAESATRILRHYLARHPEMADSAIGKLMAWYDGNGETELGL